MAYCVAADVRKETFFKDTTNIQDALITQKIAEADKFINSMIRKAYVLPLSSTPAIIVNLSKKIAAIYLYKDQSTNIEIQPGVSTKDEFLIQIDILKSIQKRKITLTDDNENEFPLTKSALPVFYPNAASSVPGTPNGTAPAFTRNKKY